MIYAAFELIDRRTMETKHVNHYLTFIKTKITKITNNQAVSTVAPLVQRVAVQHRADRKRAREVGFLTQNRRVI